MVQPARTVGLVVILVAALGMEPAANQASVPSGEQKSAQSRPSLSAEDKVEIVEALRLKSETGNQIWPGLAGSDIPVVLYNAAFEFLVGEFHPPQPWEAVPGDEFEGRPYFRRAAVKPQSFAVKVGDRWAGRIGTLEWMQSQIPIRLGRDYHLVALLHEVFHAFQAARAPKRFARALDAYQAEKRYPFKDPDFATAWTEEGAALAQALKAADDALARRLAGKFLEIRKSRRDRAGLDRSLLDYERELEWLEGTAKYAEVRFYELAGARTNKTAAIEFASALPFLLQFDFVRLERQLAAQDGDLRFYLSGMAQARLLDRLSPAWKSKTDLATLNLEDILTAVIAPRPDERSLVPNGLLD